MYRSNMHKQYDQQKTGEQYNVNELAFNDFVFLKALMSNIRLTTGSMKINDVIVLKYSIQTPDLLYYKNPIVMIHFRDSALA